jgi:nucleoside-diphosphate-sugar epimerase
MDFNQLKGKKIAITGGAGFIGHNLALKLKSFGADVHVVDSLQVNSLGYYTSGYTSNPNSELYISIINERLRLLRDAGVELHIIDLRDYHLVSHTLTRIEPETVIHLAAVSHANRSNKDPFSTFDHSMRTLENVLDATRGRGIHLIYFSSSMVYGNFDGDAVKEDRVCHPMGIYGALKYGAEKLVIAYNQVFNLPYTIIRPSALYGERCVSRRVGQAFIENALVGKDLSINGDGTDGLDFTYIQDLIQGVMRCILHPGALGEIFNLTYGGARSINQMAEIVKEHFPNIQIKNNPRDGLMPERGTLNIDKAKRILGYQPEFPLDKGFVQYIEWYKEFFAKSPGVFNQQQSL